jgi:photosystem II stability/assembly factor-like uncharacterized protein
MFSALKSLTTPQRAVLSLSSVVALGAALAVVPQVLQEPVSESGYRARIGYKDLVKVEPGEREGATENESLPLIKGRLEWLRARYGNPPAGLAQRLIREVQKQWRLYPNQRPGATPLGGTPVWVPIGPTNALYLQNGVNLRVVDSGRLRTILPHPTNPNIVYVLTSGGGIWKTTNFTAAQPTWTPITDNLLTTSGGAMAFGRDPNTLYLGLGDPFDFAVGGVIVKSTDGGATWSPFITLPGAKIVTDIQVDTSGANDVVLVGTDVGLFRSADGGATYTPIANISGPPLGLFAWSLAKTSAGWLVTVADQSTGLSTIYRSTDIGATWTALSSSPAGAGRTTLGVGIPGDSVVYAYAANQNDAAQLDLFRSADGGLTWTALNITNEAPTNPNSNQPTMDLMAGQAFYNQLVLVDPTDQTRNTVYLGGQLSTARSTDGGQTWTIITNWLAQFGLPYSHADFHAAAFTNINGQKTIFFGNDGGLSISTDGGSTWSDAKNRGIQSHLIYALSTSGTDPSTVVIGLQDNGTRVRLRTSDTYNQSLGGDGFGTGWSQANGDVTLGSVFFNQIFVAQRTPNFAIQWRSTFGINTANGVFFTPIATPTPAADPTGQVFFTANTNTIYKTTNARNWEPIFRGGFGAVVNRGAQHPFGLHPSDLNRIIFAGASGLVYITSDGGSTWQTRDVRTGDYVGFNSSALWAPDGTLYVSSENPNGQSFYVLKSVDGGATWQPSANGLPLVPIQKLVLSPTDPTGKTIYAATWIGVYETTDGGANWHLFGAGLPAVQVSDIYISPNGSLMRISTYGRGVWELTMPQ